MLVNEFFGQHTKTGSNFRLDSLALDKILARLCEMVLLGQHSDQDLGWVGAAVLDPQHRCVAALNYGLPTGQRVHAERAAIDAYQHRFGTIPQGSTIVTTLSPCSEPMDDRYRESCRDLLEKHHIRKVYAGYQDPTQDHHSDFHVTYCDNPKLRTLCEKLASTFLPEQLHELSFLGSQCTKDCSGHRAGYAWYQKNQRRPQSWSMSFNKGAALAQAGK